MTNGTRGGIVLLVCALTVAGCNGSRSSSTPLMPSAAPQPAPQSPAVQVRGFVSDSAFRSLAGASIEVVDGPQAGLTTRADANGSFSLAGTFDDSTRFRATQEGHVASIGTLLPNCAACSSRFIYFYLSVLAPPVSIAGDYTLTFVAAGGACDHLVPNELQTRTYAATITPGSNPRSPDNTFYNVNVSGAPFLANYGSFPVGVAGNDVAFELRGEGPYLVEQVAENTYLGFDGRAEATVGASGVSTISTSFEGFIHYCAMSSPMGPYYDCRPGVATTRTHCESKNHRLILTRR